jgi:hypothetical protein
MGAMAGAGALGAGSAEAQLLMPQNLPSDPSPPTTPFLAPLQIMPLATPIDPARLDLPPHPDRHQRYDEFPPVKFYEMRERQLLHSYHPELPPTVSWGYDASIPGLT